MSIRTFAPSLRVSGVEERRPVIVEDMAIEIPKKRLIVGTHEIVSCPAVG